TVQRHSPALHNEVAYRSRICDRGRSAERFRYSCNVVRTVDTVRSIPFHIARSADHGCGIEAVGSSIVEAKSLSGRYIEGGATARHVAEIENRSAAALEEDLASALCRQWDVDVCRAAAAAPRNRR